MPSTPCRKRRGVPLVIRGQRVLTTQGFCWEDKDLALHLLTQAPNLERLWNSGSLT